ncbi:hypothetical protein Sjap_016009 [Stephania japonica]|uniref:Bet v I/Major latex protein domain-containing protein n=1 Tax=Stephania japonica TaxID=461633 RepID=A0AAP0IM70_9MAGN
MGKLEIDVQANSPAEKLWAAVKDSSDLFPKFFSNHIKSIEVLKVDGYTVGEGIWHYCLHFIWKGCKVFYCFIFSINEKSSKKKKNKKNNKRKHETKSISPIVKDMKSANILIDKNFYEKVRTFNLNNSDR